MAFDEQLAGRLRHALRARPGITERKMFGGLAFMFRGHMFIGITGNVLMARVGPDAYEKALSRPHARVMDFTGKPMKGYVFVDPAGFAQARDLSDWLRRCLAFAQTLPPKQAK